MLDSVQGRVGEIIRRWRCFLPPAFLVLIVRGPRRESLVPGLLKLTMLLRRRGVRQRLDVLLLWVTSLFTVLPPFPLPLPFPRLWRLFKLRRVRGGRVGRRFLSPRWVRRRLPLTGPGVPFPGPILVFLVSPGPRFICSGSTPFPYCDPVYCLSLYRSSTNLG